GDFEVLQTPQLLQQVGDLLLDVRRLVDDQRHAQREVLDRPRSGILVPGFRSDAVRQQPHQLVRQVGGRAGRTRQVSLVGVVVILAAGGAVALRGGAKRRTDRGAALHGRRRRRRRRRVVAPPRWR